MDKEKIKKALDHFENDQFVDAKDIISQEIKDHRDKFVQDKLGLKNEINPKPEKKDDGEE
jgi:hypothetical protein